uniref:PARP-type domain-containing protein n=1 Tax=Hucho hucho TaxID=62062 RepID=A0A4W5K5Z0_9TELE
MADKCKKNIAKDSLQMAIMVQSPMFDGKVPHWHHFSCFCLRAAAQSPADIAGFSDLRFEDQEKVKKAIETGGATGGQALTSNLSPSMKSSVYPCDAIEKAPPKK